MNPLLPIEYALIFSAAAIAAAIWLGWKSSAKTNGIKRIAITGLRAGTAVLLMLIVLNPGHWQTKETASGKKWAIMLDRSMSMEVKDVDGKSRWKQASSFANRLCQEKDIPKDIHTFSSGLEEKLAGPETLENIKADGKSTDITGSAEKLIDIYKAKRSGLAGIIIISDGRQVKPSDGKELSLLARAENIPVYALATGGKVPRKNISVTTPRRCYTAFSGESVSIPLTVGNTNMGNIGISLKLSCNGKTEQTKKLQVEDNSTTNAEFKIKFKEKGIYKLLLATDHVPGDGIQDDDQCEIMISAIDEKIKILMIEGQPFWDSKFLSQTLRKDPNINLTNIYRLSATRYFEVKTDESNVSESEKPIFPDTLKELAAFDIIIFGKGVEYFLDSKRINLLKSYLKDSGGAILMARAKPYTGELPALESIEPMKWGEALSADYKWEPTAAGAESGIFGDYLPGINSRIWSELPELSNAYRSAGLNAFSEVLAQGKPASGQAPFPVLISRKYGKGIVTALNSEGLWKWDFFPAGNKNEAFYGELWIQLIHWMARHSDYLPGFNMSMRLNRTSVLPGEPVTALLAARSPQSKRSDIIIKIMKDSKTVESVRPVFDKDGLSGSAIIVPEKSGIYTIELSYREDGKEMNIPAMLFVKRAPEENDELSADADFLKTLCEESGGRLLDNIKPAFPETGKEKQAEETGSEWIPLWDNWITMLAIIAFFAAECFIRRRNGML